MLTSIIDSLSPVETAGLVVAALLFIGVIRFYVFAPV